MAGEGLFFTGTVLKNNRDLLKEEATRQQLEIQREQLELQKQAAADKRKENSKKNAPKFKEFGESDLGDLDFYIRNKTKDYVGWVGNNYEEGVSNEYYTGKANRENEIVSETSILKKIRSDFQVKRNDLSKGGQAVDQANYVRNEDGSYEFENRYNIIKQGLREGMTAQEAADMYYDNTDGSLYKVREQTSLGQGIVDSYKGDGKSSELYDSDDGKKTMIGWREDAKNAIYTSYKNELKFNNKGIFETPEGEKAYFKSRFNGESRMVLFFRDKKGKLTADENSPILTQLDPKSEDFDRELSNEYVEYLAKEETSPFMVNKGFQTKSGQGKDKTFDDAYELRDYEEMLSSNKYTEVKYGSHGRMLTDKSFTNNTGGEHDITEPMLNNMQASSDSPFSSEESKKAILKHIEKSGGKIKSKLSQVAISEDKKNMYGIYSIQVSKEATTDGSQPVIQISVPLNNIDLKFGPVINRWVNTLNLAKQGAYDQQEESSSQNKGGAPRPSK